MQVVEVNAKVESAGTHNVHNNAFYAEEKLLKSELQAMRDCDPSSARHWIVRALFSCFNFLLCIPIYHGTTKLCIRYLVILLRKQEGLASTG